MSKLKVDEIRDITDSTTIPPAIPGLQPQLAQAWVNFDGTGVVTIRDQYNVASITDNGTGNYTVNYTSVIGSNAAISCFSFTWSSRLYSQTSSSVNVITADSGGTLADPSEVCVLAFSN